MVGRSITITINLENNQSCTGRIQRKYVRQLFDEYIALDGHVAKRGRYGKIKYKSYREMAKDLDSLVTHATLHRWMKLFHRSIYRAMADAD
jgi:hypothetical protein